MPAAALKAGRCRTRIAALSTIAAAHAAASKRVLFIVIRISTMAPRTARCSTGPSDICCMTLAAPHAKKKVPVRARSCPPPPARETNVTRACALEEKRGVIMNWPHRRSKSATLGVVYLAVASFALLWLAGSAWAAAAPPVKDGRAVGVFCGVILLGLVFYSLFLYCRPLLEDEGEGLIWALLLLLAILVIKLALLPVLPGLGI